MKLKILMDNHTEIDVYYLGEPAVSYWIETEGKAFLFDAAYSDAFLKNAKDMGVDVTKAEAVLLSSRRSCTGRYRLSVTSPVLLLTRPSTRLGETYTPPLAKTLNAAASCSGVAVSFP